MNLARRAPPATDARERCFWLAKNWSIGLVVLLLFPFHSRAAQFVEVFAEIEGTSWDGEKIPHRRTYNTRFVVGTNLWFFEGNFALNATHRYWFTGTNIVQEIVITDRLPEQERVGGLATRRPEIGERYVRIHTARSADLRDFAYVSWMSFCSGSFLKSSGREIALPFQIRTRLQPKSDKTSVFEDGLGLPRNFELYGTDKQTLCDYTVQQSTNFLGWNFPLSFKLVQYRDDNGEPWVQALGKVLLLRTANEPVLPPQVLDCRR